MTTREEILAKLRDAIVHFDIDGVKATADQALKMGVSPYEAVMKGMAEGMNVVGKKYQEGEYFLAELIMAGETMKEGLGVLEPHIDKENMTPEGIVVIGTVQGDLHDIGKNVVATLLGASGFEVHDLGVDVPPEKFVEESKASRADIVGLSALLTMTMHNMSTVIDRLKAAGIEAKVIVGGAPVTEEFAKNVGADGYARDAVEGVGICKQWTKERK